MEGLPRRFGKYTLIRKLAVGGMAELFLAHPAERRRLREADRHQAHPAGDEPGPRVHRHVPPRGAHRRDALAPEHRPDLRRRAGRRHLLHRDGARPRRGSPLDRAPDEEEGGDGVPARARDLDRARHVRRARLRAREARPRRQAAEHRSPRHLAAERRRYVQRRREDRRLRHRQERREAPATTRGAGSSRGRSRTCRRSRRAAR